LASYDVNLKPKRSELIAARREDMTLASVDLLVVRARHQHTVPDRCRAVQGHGPDQLRASTGDACMPELLSVGVCLEIYGRR
jgi:hypothetical protein